jgi:urease accessory protein
LIPRRAAILLITILTAPNTALAHGSIEGIGDFYSGILHPALVPAHLLVLLSLGLLLGQHGLSHSQISFPVFVLTLTIGLLVTGLNLSAAPPVSAVLIIPALTGVLVAVSPKSKSSISVTIATISGLILGLDSAPETLITRARIMTLFGTGIGVSSGLIYMTGLGELLKKYYQGIPVRILGSWVAACSLLVLALASTDKIQP